MNTRANMHHVRWSSAKEFFNFWNIKLRLLLWHWVIYVETEWQGFYWVNAAESHCLETWE